MISVDVLGEILAKLGRVRAQCPELRFGQLLATVGMLSEDETGHSLWDVEDTDFAAALDRFAADMARRESNRAEPDTATDPGGIASFHSPIPQTPQQLS